MNLEKGRFKIGTLDSLMELNETLAKVDQTLDSTVKKIEKQANEMYKGDLRIEVTKAQQVDVFDYIKNFSWDDNKFNRGRSLVEIAGLITERMRSIDSDIKVLNDTMNETKNNLAQLVKKEGTTLMTKDVAEVIYSDQNIRPRDVFIEMEGSAIFSTLIVILHKTKIDQFRMAYEKLYRDEASGLYAAVPESCKYLGIEDKEGN